MSQNNKTENWNSNLGVVLAVAGSAIGFGNFLRFPGLAAQYGGGAFMIAYFISFLLLGIPLSWVEWAIGRKGGSLGGHSTASILYLICGSRRWKYMGIAGVIAPLALCMYYIYLEAWTLGYAWHTATGDLNLQGGEAFGNFFVNFVGIREDGYIFTGESTLLIFFLLTLLANFYLIYRGVNKGIEWFCKWSMPLLGITAIIILVRVLTIGTPNPAYPERNVNQGLGYMWNPDKTMLVTGEGKTLDMVNAHATPEQKQARIAHLQAENPGTTIREERVDILKGLMNPEMWLHAAGQVFFSLSVGFGTVCTYASYVRRRKDIALGSLSANTANAAAEVGLAGMMIIPAAVSFLGVAASAGASTFGLGFNVLPQVFRHMPAGQVFGTLFFILLFIGAITSAISMLQPAVAFLEEFWNLRRAQSVSLVAFILIVGALMVAWFTGGSGLIALGTLDFWFGTMCLYICAGMYLYIFNIVWGSRKGLGELREGALIHVPDFLRYIILFVTPGIMAIIFAAWLYQNIFHKTSEYVALIARGEPGAIIPLVWVFLIVGFFAFVIHTSEHFSTRHTPKD